MQNFSVVNSGKCPKLPWMIDFHSTADGQVLNNQLEAAFADNYLEHLCSLHPESKIRRKRLVQFSTYIPARVSLEQLEEFLKAGMTMAVLRLDIFTLEELEGTLELLKLAIEKFGKKLKRVAPIAIGIEIPEHEFVTGKLLKPQKAIRLSKGDRTKVCALPEYENRVTKDQIYVNYDRISDTIQPGDSLILGNDEIRMTAIRIARSIVDCIVDKAGMLSDNISVQLPNIPVEVVDTDFEEKLTKLKNSFEIDFMFVGPNKLEKTIEIMGPSIRIFLKVEYAATLKIFDEVVEPADGVLLNGEKLMATSQEKVFLIQKSIIAKCIKLGKPIIAVINCHSITKAQVNDIANTVIDGVDGLLLPANPDLMESIGLICKIAEDTVFQKQLFNDLCSWQKPPIEPITSVAMSAVEASFKSNAAAIILITTTGRSAKMVSMFKPRCPIIALTRFGRIAKQLTIYKGVIPIFYVMRSQDSFTTNVEKKIQLGMTFGKVNGYIRMGDAVVIVFGIKNNVGFRNCMEVVFASEYDTIPDE